MKSVTVGVWVAVGGRHEAAEDCGISHFVEHMLFKGTKTRSARDITEAVEGVGGFVNAFTTEDHTCYYAKAGAKYLPLLGDVLLDMMLHSRFDPEELEREREVIREEILMYRDQPSQHAEEVLTDLMWPRHPLGRPLTGSVETLATFTRRKVQNFVKETYNASTILITVAGNATHADALAALKPLASKFKAGPVPAFQKWKSLKWKPEVRSIEDDTEQSHLSLGAHSVSRLDPSRFSLKLLSVILGENMSSRLFQQLRENRGLCYSIQSETMCLEDTGLLNISVGLDAEKVEKAVRLIAREFRKLGEKDISARELRQAKDYSIGHNELCLESTTHQMMWLGESILAYGRAVDPTEVQRSLAAVTAADLRATAARLLDPAKVGLAIVGHGVNADKVRAALA
jgi:predicted Zn-dependent peptidase